MSEAEVFLAVLRARRSVRRFRDEPVPRALLEHILEAACWAPSAGNRQDWFFAVVTDAARKQEMGEAVRQRWTEIVAANRDLGAIEEVAAYAATFADFERAPAVVVVSSRIPDPVQEHLLGVEAAATVGAFASAAMAAQNLMLAAHALGLASCCMTGALAARAALARLLGLGRRREIVCLVAIGYPLETPPAPARRPLSEVTRFIE